MTAELFPLFIERGCGIDIHRDSAVATIKGKDIVSETKTFNTFTDDLYELVGWLQNNGVTHVAMESTGVYWLFYFLDSLLGIFISKFIL